MIRSRVYVKCAVYACLVSNLLRGAVADLQHDDVCPEWLVVHQSSRHMIVREAVGLNLLEDMDRAQTTHNSSYSHTVANQYG